jgi:superfamily II DNA helicase RecQ
VQLLNYFGETDAIPCGGCDVCRDQKKHGLDERASLEMGQRITDILMHASLPVETILEQLKEFERNELLHFIQWKMELGEWTYNDKLELSIANFDDNSMN